MKTKKPSSMQAFYAVRNKEGKFYKSRGTGYGNRWVDKLSDAKIYGKIGPAKGVVTYWSKSFPEYGVPDIVEITVTEENIKIIDQTSRIVMVARIAKERAEKLKVANLKRQKKYLQDQIDRLNKQMGKLD